MCMTRRLTRRLVLRLPVSTLTAISWRPTLKSCRLGTRIKIKWAGGYSGEYVVADTGAKIEGRRLDIYMPSTTKARKFGIRQ